MSQSVSFTVPLVPPSVNHYWIETYQYNRIIKKTVLAKALSPEAVAFKSAVAVFAKGRTVIPVDATKYQLSKVRYALNVTVYLGVGERGDGDNFFKGIGDGLVDAGVIHSDARIKSWHIEVDDTDRKNPRTEIQVSLYSAKEVADATAA